MFSDHILCPNCAGMRLFIAIPLLCCLSLQLGWCKLPPPRECSPGECVRHQMGGLFASHQEECLEWCPKPIEVKLSPEDRKLLASVIAKTVHSLPLRSPDAGRAE